MLINDLNIDIIEDIDIIDGSGILNIWGNRLYDIFTIIFYKYLVKEFLMEWILMMILNM